MTDWLHAEYRDFDTVPRSMLCRSARATYFFLSRLDTARGTCPDVYEAYRLHPMGEGEVCQSWFGLEMRAIERLPDIRVSDFPFDVTTRRFLPYDAIASSLGE
jgi:hypothetical protein